MIQKKMISILGITALLLKMAFPAMANSEPCANGAGVIIYGNEHGRYCYGNKPMNWWSAFAWCDAAGGKLVTPAECSSSTTVGTSECPNLQGKLQSCALTSASADAEKNYRIDIPYGGIYKVDGEKKSNVHCRPLCVMN